MRLITNLVMFLGLGFATNASASTQPQPLFFYAGDYILVVQKIESSLPMEKRAWLMTGRSSEAYFQIFRQRVGQYPKVGTQFAACEEADVLTFKLFEIGEDHFVKLAASSEEVDLKTCRAKATEVNLRLPLLPK